MSTSDVMGLLSRVSIFSHMKKKDLKRLAKLARAVVYGAGDVIVREGERDGRMFIITQGEAKAVKGIDGDAPATLRAMGPGSYFGEMALVDDLIRTASVVAVRQTAVLVIDQLNLRAEIEKYPGLAIELLQMFGRRIRELEQQLAAPRP